MKIWKKISWLGLFFLVMPYLSWANQIVGIETDQTIFSFDAYPGESQNLKISIKNIAGEKSIIKINARDFEIGEDNKISVSSGKNEVNGMSDWVRINEKNSLLSPGESKEIYFSVNIPEEATVGSHYADLVIQSFPEISLENSQKTIVSGELGVHLLVNVKGDVSGKGKLTRIEAPLLAKNEADISVEYENQGNIHYVPHGEIISRNLLTGRETTEKTDKRFVFPGKKYVFEKKEKINPFFGIYLVRANFVDGEGEILSKSKYILGAYLPLLLLIIFLGGLSFWFLRKKKVINPEK